MELHIRLALLNHTARAPENGGDACHGAAVSGAGVISL